MSTAERLAADVRAPNDVGRVADDFGVLKFTSDTTHKTHVLPKEWEGRYVTIYATGDVHFAFSTSPTAEVDRSVTAIDAGAASKVGGIVGTIPRSMRLPRAALDGRVYFTRESASAATVYIELSSGAL